MTKQEKIQEAYGKYWEQVKEYVNKNGWCSVRRGVGFDEIISNLSWETRTGNQYCWRPKTLQGIEDNNGWIKIESEEDLPMTNGKIIQYFFVTKSGNITENGYSDLMKNKKIQYSKVYTHYQQIIRPREPLY